MGRSDDQRRRPLLGVMFAVVLANFQLGTMFGLLAKNTLFVYNAGADLWIVPPGTTSALPGQRQSIALLHQARVTPGEAEASPLVMAGSSIRKPDGGSEAVTLVGVDLDTLHGGPFNVVAGDPKRLRDTDTMFFEDAQRERFGGLNLGSVREVGGHNVRVGGFTWGLLPFGPAFAFGEIDLVRTIVGIPSNELSFVLVRVAPGEDPELAVAATAALLLLLAWSVVPAAAVLRDPKTGGFLTSPFLSGIVPIIVVLFWVPAVVYGAAVGTIRSDTDVVRMMAKALSGMGSYLVLVFFAAQFIAFFSWTHLGHITAIEGALGLQAIGLTGWPLLVAFVLVSGAVNLVIASASAKWALMAPVFVPMFMLLGYARELTLAAFRVADSSTTLITPMLTYFPLIIALAQRYRKDAGIGTMIAVMLPYSIAFLLSWTLFLLGWVALGFPLGPGAPLRLPS